MRWNHPVYLAEDQLLAECQITFSRSSGPGGQNRNKVETSVSIEHPSSGIIGQASERRNQIDNRKVAVQRLRLNLAVHWLPLNGTEQRDASDSAADCLSGFELVEQYQRLGRIEIADSNWDFPIVVFESLQALRVNSWNISDAARRISVSSSQLIKLLKKCPAAFQRLNEERDSRGLLKLK